MLLTMTCLKPRVPEQQDGNCKYRLHSARPGMAQARGCIATDSKKKNKKIQELEEAGLRAE